MADERRVFPTETVLELVAGKKDADTRDLVNFLLGKTITYAECAQAAASFAIAWLSRWNPRFMDLDWKDDGNWKQFVAQAKSKLGENLSLAPISGRLKTIADNALNSIKEAHESLLRQTDAAAKLEQRVAELEPLEQSIKNLQKKNDELEAKLKSSKKDMQALNRKALEFEGKMAVDNEQLMQIIKDTIKDALKTMAVSGGATAGTAAALAEAEMPVVEADPPADEWGFKSSRKKKNDW